MLISLRGKQKNVALSLVRHCLLDADAGFATHC